MKQSSVNQAFVVLSFGLSTIMSFKAGAAPVAVAELKGIYRAYYNGSKTANIETKDKITLGEARTNCKKNYEDNDRKIFIKCTLDGQVFQIYKSQDVAKVKPFGKECGLFSGGSDTTKHLIASPNPVSSIAKTDTACIDYCEHSVSRKKAGVYVCAREYKAIKTIVVKADASVIHSSSKSEVEALKKQVAALSSSQTSILEQLNKFQKFVAEQITALKSEIAKGQRAPASASLSREEVKLIAQQEALAASKLLSHRLIAVEARACRAEFKAQNLDFRSYECMPKAVLGKSGMSLCLAGAKVGSKVSAGIKNAEGKILDEVSAECKEIAPNKFELVVLHGGI